MRIFLFLLVFFNLLIANNELELNNIKEISLKDKSTFNQLNKLNKKYYKKYFEYFNKQKIEYFKNDIINTQNDFKSALIICELIFKEKFSKDISSLFKFNTSNLYIEYNSCRNDYKEITENNKKILEELKIINKNLIDSDEFVKVIDFKYY